MPRRRGPRQPTLRVAFLGSIDTKVVHVVDGPLGTQQAAQNGERFVVQLDRVGVEAVLDTHAFLTLVEVTDDFTSGALGDLTAERHTSAGEADGVGGAGGG